MQVILAFGATPTKTLNEFIPLYVEYVWRYKAMDLEAAISMSVQSITILQLPKNTKEPGIEV